MRMYEGGAGLHIAIQVIMSFHGMGYGRGAWARLRTA